MNYPALAFWASVKDERLFSKFRENLLDLHGRNVRLFGFRVNRYENYCRCCFQIVDHAIATALAA
jgi:hypothetical protein